MGSGKQLVILICILFFSIAKVEAQAELPKDSLELSVFPYGSFRGHFAFYNEEVEFQENASRVGVQIGVNKAEMEFFLGVELGMNLFKSNSQFNADGNSASGFILTLNEQANQVFNSRLGYLGFRFGKYGSISFGKQWSVYYDITSYTDNFNVFGAQASSTFVAGTDGGSIGTGRADQSMIYRNEIGPLIIGLQLQAKNVDNENFIDGLAASLQYQIFEELKAGIGFNHSYLNDFLIDEAQILGLDDDPFYFTAGLNYQTPHLLLGAVYSKHTNGDLARGFPILLEDRELSPTVIFNAYGLEVFGRYNWDKFSLMAGYNHYTPDIDEIERVDNQLALSEDFKTRDFILGAEYRPAGFVFIYSELRIGTGNTSEGLDTTDVLALGLKIQADHMFKKNLKPK
ncbi:porin [Gramella sp. GC03-9]|uniref:Porin n=1 Tax=Christiangramia oceanisediminis TaxID=2920386 RepID=A0A9X2KYQ8_9FLAO|nr:porin [Gramella oceanisediminis]MCP9200848.1 porin [Gramella oceanisediminis]